MIIQSPLVATPRSRAARVPATAFAVLCLLLLLSLTAPLTHAQTAARVRGSVVDAVSGKAVAGAIVRLVGSSVARTSNVDGEFELDVAPVAPYDLVAETPDGRIGVAANLSPSSSSGSITIRISRDRLLGGDLLTSASLHPVSSRLAPYAVDVVTSRDMPVPASVNALASLEGKVSGLAVARINGLPGSDVSQLLRSPISINPDAAPLVVVDGVLLSTLHERSLQDIDALDIDRIEVIKGAAAASLYGYQGMHGVVVIQTKRGRSNALGRPQFSLRNEVGYDEAGDFTSSPLAHPYLVNAAGQYVNAAGLVVPRSQRVRQASNIAENRYIDPTFDHDAQVFRRASFNSQTVSLSQNLSTTNYALSYARTRQQSTFVGADGIVRHTARLNLDHQWKQWLGINISAARVEGSDVPTVANLGTLLSVPADVNLRASDPAGKDRYDPIPDFFNLPQNPLVQQDQSQLEQQRQRTLLNVGLSSRPTSWLMLHASGSYDRGYQDTRNARVTSRLNSGARVENRDRLTDSVAFGRFRGGATVSRSFGQLQSHLSVETTTQRERSESTSDDMNVVVGTDGVETIQGRSSTRTLTERRVAAGVANLAVDYAGTYVADIAFRRERSSLFGAAGWTNFVRGNVAWLLNEESWLPFRGLELFKLRAGVGTSEAPAYGAYTYGFRSQTPSVRASTFIVTERELGMDVALNGRVRGSFSHASFHSNDIERTAPCFAGYCPSTTNTRGFRGKSFEATVQFRVLDLSDGLQWDVRAVADHRTARISNNQRSCYEYGITFLCEGNQLTAMYGASFVRQKSELPARHSGSSAAFDVNDEGFVVPVGAGNTWRDGKAKNLWGTSVVVDGASYPWGIPLLRREDNNQLVYREIGNANAALRYGLQNTFQFKALRLYALLNGQIGGDIYDGLRAYQYQQGNHADIDQSNKPDELRKPVGYYVRSSSVFYDDLVKDATHLRLSEASVGVTLDAARMPWMRRIGARRIDVDLVGRNLFTLTNYDGLNPQAPMPTSPIDGIRYPLSRTFTLATAIVF